MPSQDTLSLRSGGYDVGSLEVRLRYATWRQGREELCQKLRLMALRFTRRVLKRCGPKIRWQNALARFVPRDQRMLILGVEKGKLLSRQSVIRF